MRDEDGARIVPAVALAVTIATTVAAVSTSTVPPAPPPAGPTSLVEPLPPSSVSQADLDRLRARALSIPVVGVAREDLHDTFADLRGLQLHEGIDLVAPAGTPVAAVEDGTIAKLFVSVAGGLTVYHFDPDGAYAYYYAHLDRYAEGLREGQAVKRGEVIGYVGTTGNAGDTAHLHFAIFKLGPERRWWEGAAVNPYVVLRDVIE